MKTTLVLQLKTKMIALFLVLLLFVVHFFSVGCKNNFTLNTIYFPVATESSTEYPLVLARGRLVLDKNCLRLKYFYFPGRSDLIIWPYGYSLKSQDNRICVVDKNGQIVAKVGDRIKVRGGNVLKDIAEKYTGEPIPDNYGGPYWIASEVKRG